MGRVLELYEYLRKFLRKYLRIFTTAEYLNLKRWRNEVLCCSQKIQNLGIIIIKKKNLWNTVTRELTVLRNPSWSPYAPGKTQPQCDSKHCDDKATVTRPCHEGALPEWERVEPKHILICEPVLLCFDSDTGTWVSADASKDGPGAMLFQEKRRDALGFLQHLLQDWWQPAWKYAWLWIKFMYARSMYVWDLLGICKLCNWTETGL